MSIFDWLFGENWQERSEAKVKRDEAARTYNNFSARHNQIHDYRSCNNEACPMKKAQSILFDKMHRAQSEFEQIEIRYALKDYKIKEEKLDD